ncbi:MAG TPA: hypothetical protein VJG49_00645 [Candidatus Nanoarchaeia archaeon]|nr:hypothetical protein [Candidatus Nanoarchaeia archaeon]
MINHKKAVTASFIVGMMITLVAFVLISGTLIRFMSKAEGKEAEILCHDSLLLRSKSIVNVDHELANMELKLVPVLCATQDKKIKGTRTDLKRQIANDIAKCWWMFGEGRFEEILHGSDVDILPRILATEELENKCFNCYTVLVDQDYIEGGPIPSTEFMDFLATEKYPLKNMTYLQYLQGYGGPGRFVYLATEGDQFISQGILPRHGYSISMAPKLQSDEDSFWKGLAEIGVAVVGALVIGIATGGTGWIAIGSAVGLSALGVAGVQDLKASIYGERDVSSIYFDTLESGQQFCGSGDISGE